MPRIRVGVAGEVVFVGHVHDPYCQAEAKRLSELSTEFAESWAQMVAFYEFFATQPVTAGADVAKGMLPLTRQLAASDVASQFRAGQGLTTLIISRAAVHGLDDGDPFITVYFSPKHMYRIAFHPHGSNGRAREYVASAEDVSSTLAGLLEALKTAVPLPGA